MRSVVVAAVSVAPFRLNPSLLPGLHFRVMDLVIAPDDPRRDDARRLLASHLAFANEHSPPEDVHALDIDGLVDPAISFFSAQCDGALLGVGALKHLESAHVELKSMHTAASARGLGVGRAILDHLIGLAIQRGYQRMSLETGTMAAFAPARALYESVGFVPCEPFGQYFISPNSVCMTRSLADR